MTAAWTGGQGLEWRAALAPALSHTVTHHIQLQVPLLCDSNLSEMLLNFTLSQGEVVKGSQGRARD